MTKSIQGVEIFATGTWNNTKITEKDLDDMVHAFQQTATTYRPPLKLGHDTNQTLLQQDGMPAAGWITNLYRMGGKLLADFAQIPDKIYDLIKNGAYKKVSCEIWANATVLDKQYKRIVSAVSLLGADRPAVQNLNDIMAWYSVHESARKSASEIQCYDSNLEGLKFEPPIGGTKEKESMSKTEKEIELEAKLAAEQAKFTALEKSKTDADKELADLKEKAKQEEAARVEAEKQAFAAQLDKEVTELQSEKLITPAMQPFVRALLGEEKKEYAFGEGDKAKKFSKSGLLKEVLKLSASSKVNLTEGSKEGKKAEGNGTTEAQLKEIETYAKEHKVSFTDAYKVVMKKQDGNSSVNL